MLVPEAALALNFHLPHVSLPSPPNAADTDEFQGGLRSLGVQLGVASPTETNRFDRFAKNGPSIGVQYLYYALDWIAVGGEFGYTQFGKNTGSVDGAAAPKLPASIALGVRSNALAFSFLTRVNLRTQASWTPYLLGGAGYSKVSMKWSASDLPAGASLSKSGGGTSGLDVIGAAGLEAFVFHGASLSFEARYTEYRHTAQTVDNLPVVPDSIESLSYLLGMHFWFGE